METLDPTLKFILERARETAPVMTTLAADPYQWSWSDVSPADYNAEIEAVDAQFETLFKSEAALTAAGADWDSVLNGLMDDAALGIRLARVRYKDKPVPARLFETLRTDATNRDAKYRQALDFETSWQQAESAWVFKDKVTLANFRTRRKSAKDKEDVFYIAQKAEQHDRALLHSLAMDLNAHSMDWYEVATATFAEGTVAGQLVRTIPTTYDPNRPPGLVEFSEHTAPGPNEALLRWRAPRGNRFKLLAKAPGASDFDVLLDNVPTNEWLGQSLEAGTWVFKGRAINAFGEGPESGEITVPVKAA